MVAVVGSLGLAATLAGCQGSAEGGGALGESASGQTAPTQDLSAFWDAMESLPANYVIEYREDYVLGDEGTGEKGTVHYAAQCDELDGDARVHIVYAEDDTLSPGLELYQEGTTLIRIVDGMAVDVTAAQEKTDDSAALNTFVTAGLLYAQENFTEAAAENDETVYRFVFDEGEIDGGYGMADRITKAEESCRFNAEGALIEEVVRVEGFAEVDGVQTPVKATTTIRYSQWDAAEVPTAPTPEVTQVGTELAVAADAVKSCIQGLPANFSCQTETTMTATTEGQTQTSEIYVEALLDRSGDATGATYVEIDGNETDAVTTLFAGDRVVTIQHGEIVSDERSGAPSDPTGSERALALVDAAKTIDVYEYNDGLKEYVLDVDKAKLGAGFFDGVDSLDDLAVHYYLDAEGSLVTIAMQGTGVAVDATVGIDVNTTYYDFGTTEVPALP